MGETDGRLEIFYVGTGEQGLYNKWQTSPGGGWSETNRLDNAKAKQVTVAQNADGRLEVFYVGTNSKIYLV